MSSDSSDEDKPSAAFLDFLYVEGDKEIEVDSSKEEEDIIKDALREVDEEVEEGLGMEKVHEYEGNSMQLPSPEAIPGPSGVVRFTSPHISSGDISPISRASTLATAAPSLSHSPVTNRDEPRHQVVQVPVVLMAERGRGRGGCTRGGRGGGRAGVRSRPRMGDDRRCQQGDRLHEIYVNDNDVPDDLREVIMNEYARRQNQQMRNDRKRRARNDDDVYYDADDGGDAALFAGDEDALHFDWRPMDTFQGQRETFCPVQTGPTATSESALEAFSQYWDEEILTHIVSETNRYAVTLGFSDWYDTNIHEILVLFAFWIMLGIIRMPSIKSCFSEYPLLSTSCFRIMFTYKRYQRLCSALHFNDNAQRTPESFKMFPIEPILSHLNARFQAAYIPRQEICISDSLTLWMGNHPSFRQSIKTRDTKFGIKTFELCESATGYLWSFFVDQGKGSTPDPFLPATLLKSTATVLSLVRPVLNKGYTLFMDNCYNSPLLARFLKRNKTDVVGTLRPNRQHVPPLIKHCKLQPGQLAARHSGDMTVMAYHDKEKVTLISTYHGNETALGTPWKTQLNIDYDKSMGGEHGVIMKDFVLDAYTPERRYCARWTIQLFKRLLNYSIFNSHICLEASSNITRKSIVFRLELVNQILDAHWHLTPKPFPSQPNVARFTDNQHWPSTIDKRDFTGRTKRRRCGFCKNRQTSFECKLCDVGLCVDVCFGKYHNIRP